MVLRAFGALLQRYKPTNHGIYPIYSITKHGVNHKITNKKPLPKIIENIIFAELDQNGISHFAHSFAKSNTRHELFFDKLASSTISNMKIMPNRNLSLILWSFSKVKIEHEELFSKASEHILAGDIFLKFQPEDISNILWAFANLGKKDARLFEHLSKYIIERNIFNARNTSDILWAFAKNGSRDSLLFLKASNTIIEKGMFDFFTAKDVAKILWAFSEAEIYDPIIVEMSSKKIMERNMIINDFNSFHLSLYLKAFAKLDVIRNLQSLCITSRNKKCSKHFYTHVARIIIEHDLMRRKYRNKGHIVDVIFLLYSVDNVDNLLFQYIKEFLTENGLCTNMSLKDIRKLLFCYEYSGIKFPHLFKSASEEIIKMASIKMFRQGHNHIGIELTYILLAFAKYGYGAHELMCMSSKLIRDQLHHFELHHFHILLWTFVNYRDVPSHSLYFACWKQILDRDLLKSFDIDTISLIAFSFVVSKMPNAGEVLSKCLQVIQTREDIRLNITDQNKCMLLLAVERYYLMENRDKNR
jgi:hypothetical protein